MRFDGEKVREAREQLGYSLEMLGREAKVSKNSALRAEHGGDIRPSTARKIARALGTEVGELLEGKENAPPSSEPSFVDVLAEERRVDVLNAINTYITDRAKMHEGELRDPASPFFRDATTATYWVEMVRTEATSWSDWAVKHASVLMPRNGGLFDASTWDNVWKVLGVLVTFHDIARRAEGRIAEMPSRPDELAERRAEKARRKADESTRRLEDLRKAVNA